MQNIEQQAKEWYYAYLGRKSEAKMREKVKAGLPSGKIPLGYARLSNGSVAVDGSPSLRHQSVDSGPAALSQNALHEGDCLHEAVNLHDSSGPQIGSRSQRVVILMEPPAGEETPSLWGIL